MCAPELHLPGQARQPISQHCVRNRNGFGKRLRLRTSRLPRRTGCLANPGCCVFGAKEQDKNRSYILARSKEPSASSTAITIIACVLTIAALYFGRQLFIPLALAVVFTFLLSPLVTFLERVRLGRVPAVFTVLVLSFFLLGTVAWGVANQVVQVMANLADYQTNLDTRIQSLRAPRTGNLSKATATVQELNKELAAVPGQIANREQQKDSRAAHPLHPIPVQVAAPPSNFVQDLRELLGPLAEPAETAAIVIILTLFMLVKREDLRNRAIRLAGRGSLNLMTQALDDAGQRLSRYLLMQCLVNAGYGIVFGLALYLLGVPHALLWAVFAGILRFVPYIGAPLAAALPVAMALAVFPGWHKALLAFAIFVVLELLVSNLLEPLLYGAHTGISSLAILVAAVFWATLWGPVGLVLSTPLTVCLMVLGRHVPQLSFLEVLLGDEPVLLPHQSFYQRLLALDQEEARAIAESYLKENSLESLYESVIVPALKLAELDHHTDGLDDFTRSFTFQTVRELIEDLGDQYEEDLRARRDQDQDQDEEHKSLPAAAPRESAAQTACIPASAGSDELVASMMAQLLRQSGYRAREFKAAPQEEMTIAVSASGCRIVCLSSISPFTVGPARSLCRRLKAGVGSLQVVMGLWNFQTATARQRLGPGCTGLLTTTLSDALRQVRELADPAPAAAAVTAPDGTSSRV